LEDVEAELLAIGALDRSLKVNSSTPLDPDLDSTDDHSDRPNSSKLKQNIRVTSVNDSDSELDI
jgi:hypothetical protein